MSKPFDNDHFADWCISMLGQPYWYGCCVYKCTESRLQSKKTQYPGHYVASRMNTYRKNIADKLVCADCVGACKGYAWTNGGQGVLEAIGTDKTYTNAYASNGCPDKSANGMFSYAKAQGCEWGSIETLPEIRGLALSMNGHVGYYVGNGYAVEWRGFASGCVKTKVSARPWTHWYKLPFINYTTKCSEPAGKRVRIFNTSSKVNVRVGNGTQYGRITKVPVDSEYEYVATADNGWNAIVINGQVGWVNGKYSKII